MLTIETRVLGKKARPLDRWSVPIPPMETADGDGGLTLRELIALVVRREVESFEARQRALRLLRVLSSAELEGAACRGRIDPGGRGRAETVDLDRAIHSALAGFEDGLYLVVLDGQEHTDLDAQIYLSPGSRLTFLRLVFLAGA